MQIMQGTSLRCYSWQDIIEQTNHVKLQNKLVLYLKKYVDRYGCERKSVNKHCFIQGINTFHVDHLEAVAAKERMRNDVVPGILANLVA